MHKTQLMGILNATPDSCFDKGRYFDPEAALARGVAMHEEGADWIDIGGESTRPGAEGVSEEEEMRRVLPLIAQMRAKVPTPLSIDTMKWRVAAEAVALGANLINDVTGFSDPRMCEVAASSGAYLCVMHMQGTPRTMQQSPSYPEGVIPHLMRWFEERIGVLTRYGVKSENIYLDPGIGFGKTVAHNLEIIQNLPRLKSLGFPLLLGISRKSFMGKVTMQQFSYGDLLPQTLAMNTVACLAKVEMLRVHDVAEHRVVIDLLRALSLE